MDMPRANSWSIDEISQAVGRRLWVRAKIFSNPAKLESWENGENTPQGG
jgi:hypothetical protein